MSKITWDEELFKERYDKAKSLDTGSTTRCATCHREFVKKTKAQAFCGERGQKNSKGKRTLCKDQYHNFMNKYRQLGARGYQMGNCTMQKQIERDRLREELMEFDDDFNCGHIFESGFFGHGQD